MPFPFDTCFPTAANYCLTMNIHPKNTESFDPIDLFANLSISCAVGAIDIKANGNSIIVRPSTLRAAFRFLAILDGTYGVVETLKLADQTLKRAGITFFWHSNHFAVLGTKAKPHILKTLIAIYKLRKFTTFSAKRRVRSH